jgi:hypothetical protein
MDITFLIAYFVCGLVAAFIVTFFDFQFFPDDWNSSIESNFWIGAFIFIWPFGIAWFLGAWTIYWMCSIPGFLVSLLVKIFRRMKISFKRG